MANILIEAVDKTQIRLTATDLDISIVITTIGTVEEMGSITLPAKKLIEIISKLPDQPVDFSLNPETNLTKISCGNAKFDLFGIPASEFPSVSCPESDEYIDIEVETLLKAIKQTIFATAVYDTNNILSGVYCNINDKKLEMASTDGNRLARIIENITNKDNKEYSFVISAELFQSFQRLHQEMIQFQLPLKIVKFCLN